MLDIDAGPRRLQRLPAGAEAAPYERFTVTPLSPTIGGEISGVDLGTPLDHDLRADLLRALLEWKVLFFRDQHLTGEQHRAFAAAWGPLEVHPFLPSGEVDDVVRFEKSDTEKGYENIWHSDVSWRTVPSFGSVLRAIEVPRVGGDTLWCDMAAAYDGLSREVRDRIESLTAVHDFANSFGALMEPDDLARWRAEHPPVEHPVVRVIPENGRRVLYVNRIFTSHIVGLEPDESDALLEQLCRQADVPEYQCRFRWQAGSVAFWDNRSTQHYACSDYWPQRRVMERVTVIGEIPVGASA